jgi:pyruvate carboxylase subunit B
MHDRQYRDYKSGVARERFTKELEQAREKAGAPIVVVRPVVEVPKFEVEKIKERYPAAQPVQAPVKGQVIWQYDVTDTSTAPVIGTAIQKGQTLCFVQTFYGLEPVVALADGTIVQIETGQGEKVEKNQVIAFLG